MIVTCPACSLRYLVDPRALGSTGRMVRCAKCANTWHQEASEEERQEVDAAVGEADPFGEPRLGEPSAGAAEEVDPFDARAARRRERRRHPPPALATPARRLPMMALAAVLAVIVAGGIAALIAHDTVAAMWPASNRFFAMIGLSVPPPGAGLTLADLAPRPDRENGVPVLIVEGTVVNTSGSVREIPKIRILLRDSGGNTVQSWSFNVPERHVAARGSVPFRTTITEPSSLATGIVVEFAEGG